MIHLQKRVFYFMLVAITFILASCRQQNSMKENIPRNMFQLNGDSSALVIVWSSHDREIALKTALAYTLNSKLNGWMQNVTLIVWGPSVELLATDKEIQNVLSSINQAGITILVDKKCVEEYKLTKEIKALNFEIKSMGKPFSDFIREKRTILTF